jgi:uncharacterized membrane protein
VNHLFFTLHMLFALFIVGPLVYATTTAGRGLRTADAAAIASAARTARSYGIASVLVVLSGMALASTKEDGQEVAKFSETWVWMALMLWLAAVAVTLAVVVPGLRRAEAMLAQGEPVAAQTGRVAAAGGIVGLLFAAIVVLMVYQPGS